MRDYFAADPSPAAQGRGWPLPRERQESSSLRLSLGRGQRAQRAGEGSAPETKAAISRDRVVSAARDWLGTPYVHQASARGAGADCLGLVRGLYTELYGMEPEAPPPYTPDWNERRPCEEPLLAAARRHLAAAPFPSSSFSLSPDFGGEGRVRGRRVGRDVEPCRAAPSSGANAPPSPPKTVEKEVARSLLRPGQILIFRIVKTGPAKHCGIVSADDHFIHAYAGRAVIESWLCRWWMERIAGVFEFPGVEE